MPSPAYLAQIRQAGLDRRTQEPPHRHLRRAGAGASQRAQLAGDGRRRRRRAPRRDAADQRHPVDQARRAARRRHRHAAGLCVRKGFRPGPDPAGDRGAVLRHLFLLSGRDEEPGQAQCVPRLRDRQGAQLGLLAGAVARARVIMTHFPALRYFCMGGLKNTCLFFGQDEHIYQSSPGRVLLPLALIECSPLEV